MSGSTMKASLLLTLEDQLAPALGRTLEVLEKLNTVIDRVTRSMSRLDLGSQFADGAGAIERAAEATQRLEQRMGALGRASAGVHTHLRQMGAAVERIGVAGAAVGGFAFLEPVRKFADYENLLTHSAITEKLSGSAAQGEMGRLSALFEADALHTGQSSETIAKAYLDLISTGIPKDVLDVAIRAHSEAATAYNISPEALGPAVGALLQNLKIPEGDLGGALAAMAYASKEGRFKVEDFSRQLPGISGLLSGLGMTGRGSANIAFAALETVMKNSGEPNQAAAGFYDALTYITGPMAQRSFGKAGIDLPGLLRGAEKQGVNPLDAILGRLGKLVEGKSPVEAAEALHGVLHNQQAAQAILALLQHKDEFTRLRETLRSVTKDTLDRDFATAALNTAQQLRLMDEEVTQLNRHLGFGFAPVLTAVNWALDEVLGGLHTLKGTSPELEKWVLTAVGGFLLFLAAAGALGFVLPAVVAGLSAIGAAIALVFNPLTLLVAAVAAAAVDIALHWDRFRGHFQEMGDGVKLTAHGLVDFFSGIFHDDMVQTVKGFEEVWGGLKGFFSGLFDAIKQPFVDFDNFMAEKLGKDWKLGGVDPKAFGSGPPPEAAWFGYHAPVQGEIVVRAAPGTAVDSTQSSGVRLRSDDGGFHQWLNTGRSVGRP